MTNGTAVIGTDEIPPSFAESVRILWQVGEGRYRNEDDLHGLVQGIGWQRHFKVERTLRVDVTATRADGEAWVRVADTGEGIAADDLERIFEEFQQTEAGARLQEGTGLGLPLARRYAELHGGTIRVASSLGHGSTFTLVIPLANGE